MRYFKNFSLWVLFSNVNLIYLFSHLGLSGVPYKLPDCQARQPSREYDMTGELCQSSFIIYLYIEIFTWTTNNSFCTDIIIWYNGTEIFSFFSLFYIKAFLSLFFLCLSLSISPITSVISLLFSFQTSILNIFIYLYAHYSSFFKTILLSPISEYFLSLPYLIFFF